MATKADTKYSVVYDKTAGGSAISVGTTSIGGGGATLSAIGTWTISTIRARAAWTRWRII